MGVLRLIFREICYRKLNFALSVTAVVAAVAVVVAQALSLDRFDQSTEAIVAAKQEETAERMRTLEDDYRKMSLKMGFNLLIVPKDQSLGDLYSEDFASRYMPEEYADRLAKARVATINHVLPSLHEKRKWPEQGRTVILVGVRGVAYLQSKKQKPLLEAVPPGEMVLGHELAASLKLAVGQEVKFAERSFKIRRIEPERGNKDDITVWISLREAQEILERPGEINAILALECNCSADRLALIRDEIAAILPDTRVVEFAGQALMRAEARNRAATEAEAAVAAERDSRAALRDEKQRFAALALPLVLVVAAVWVALLAWGNVRERAAEIGILRAIGVRSCQLVSVFLGKAMLVGLCGAAIGAALGFVAATLIESETVTVAAASSVSNSAMALIGSTLIVAPLLAAAASWLPALLAARQDPAVILREE